MRNLNNTLLLGVALPVLAPALLAATPALAAPAAAQETNAAEIVVTAQKREERLKDVPVSVTVIGKDQLASQKIASVADLARTSPSLEMIQAFGGPGGGGQVRGLGTQSFTRSAEGAVGIVVDDVPQGNVPNNAIFDLERVEVLKGPQGTLFGLTTSAGVINMKTAAPKIGAWSGYVHGDFSGKGTGGSEYGQVKLTGAVNIPLSPVAALRVAANYNRLTGVQYNAYNGVNNVLDDIAVRARLLVNASDKLTVHLSADYDYRSQNYGDPQFTYTNVAAGTGLATQLAACGITASWSNNARCSKEANDTRNRNWGASAQFDYDLDGPTLTSITGYRENHQLPSNVDIMGNPQEFEQILIKGQINDGAQFSQELRLVSPKGAKLEYTTGLFYSDFKASSSYTPGGGFIVGSYQIAPVFVTFVNSADVTHTTNTAYAAFGQATYHLTDSLGLLAGLRYSHQKMTDWQSSATPTTPLTADNVSGKIGVQYKVNKDLNLFATATRGYKGPQIGVSAGNPVTRIAAEIPTAYEIGAKGSTMGGKLGYEASLFLTKVSNYQGQRCSINGVGVLSCLGESIPSVTSKGFEATLYGRPTPNLYLNAGFAYNDAKFPNGWTGFNPSDLTGATSTSLSNVQLVGSPKSKFTFNAEYKQPVGTMEAYVGGDFVYKSSVRLGYSGDSRFVYGAHGTVSARIGLRGPGNMWSVELFGRNLTQNREPATIFGGPSFLPPATVPFLPNGQVNGISGWATTASRRQVGLSAEFRF